MRTCRRKDCVNPALTNEDRCEDHWAEDQMRWHGRSQRAKIIDMHDGPLTRFFPTLTPIPSSGQVGMASEWQTDEGFKKQGSDE